MKFKESFATMMVIGVVIFAVFMSVLDGNVVNIALPSMMTFFGVSITTVQWVVTAYLATLMLLLIPMGQIANKYGQSKMFKLGIITFTVGSFLCGVAPTLEALVACRVLQAVGGAMLFSISSAIIFNVSSPTSRGTNMGLIASIVAVGALAGPSIGGYIVQTIGWQYVFFINVPIGIVLTILAAHYFHFDEQINHDSVIEGFKEALRNPVFITALTSLILVFTAMSMTDIISPFFLQQSMGFSAEMTGFIFLIAPITMVLSTFVMGPLVDKHPHYNFMVWGVCGSCIGYIILAISEMNSFLPGMLLAFFIMGVFGCIFNIPNNLSLMGSVPKRLTATASSMSSTGRNMGSCIGALMGGFLVTLVPGNMPMSAGIAALCTASLYVIVIVISKGRQL